GFDLQRDLQAKLRRYCNRDRWYHGDDLGSESLNDHLLHILDSDSVAFRRIGVVASDFEEFDLLPLSVKHTDTRARKFCAEHGERCAEIDALPSTELRRRIRAIIESHIEPARDEWDRLQIVEETERETIQRFASALEG